MSSLDAFQSRLLPTTIEWVRAHVPFYRERYAAAGVGDAAIQSHADLGRLPTVDRHAILAAGAAARALDAGLTLAFIQHTSGTSGLPLTMWRSLEEQRFIERFFIQLASTSPAPDRLAPLILQFTHPLHGTNYSVPGRGFVLEGALHNDDSVAYIVHVLGERHRFPAVEERVGVLSCATYEVLQLTNYLVEQGIDARRTFAIHTICLTGHLLSRRWRTLVEDVWGAVIVNRFSTSEIFGGATECQRCGGFHFDPQVVPEVVSLATNEQRDEGLGELALTCLHPFLQLQPMVRYRPGDVFERRLGPCRRPSFRFMGRVGQALVLPDAPDEVVVDGVTLLDVVDAIPEVSRTSPLPGIAALRWPEAIGQPRVSGRVFREGSAWRALLEIETVQNLALFPARRKSLEEQVVADFMDRCPTLRRRAMAGELRFSVRFQVGRAGSSLEKESQLWTIDPA